MWLKLKGTKTKTFVFSLENVVYIHLHLNTCPLGTFMLHCIYHQEIEQDTFPLEHLKAQNVGFQTRDLLLSSEIPSL